jgi:hypothetical protein
MRGSEKGSVEWRGVRKVKGRGVEASEGRDEWE